MAWAIPVIPLGDALRIGAAHGREVAQAVGMACETTGVFYVTDHGLSDDLLNAQFALAERLFARQGNDQDDALALFNAAQMALAEEPLRAQMRAYSRAVGRLSRRLMQLIALSLDLPERCFDGGAADHASSVLRMLRYPPGSDVGMLPHTDEHALTVLAQDHRAGLEVKADDAQWRLVAPREGALIVHPGDALARLTAGRYRSPVHRVRRAHVHEPRWSIPYFFNPAAVR